MSLEIFSSKTRFSMIPIIGLVLFLTVSFLSGCGENAQSSFERPPAPVTVQAAISQEVPAYIDAVGKTVAREVVSIEPQVSGRITKIHFQDGSHVKRGDLLFTIDPRPYLASLHAAEADLGMRQAELELAQSEFNRMEGLIESRAISRQSYDEKKNAVEVSRARIKQSKAAVESARLNLGFCSIRSPIDGRTGHRLVDVGNVVKPEENSSLLMVERLDPIYADFTVTENDLTEVQKHMGNARLKTEIRLPETEIVREGELTFLDNAVQEGTGTVKLRATIPNMDALFWPGRFVNVKLILGHLRSAILVPAVSTQMSAQGSFVYVVKPDSTAEMRPVKLGQRHGELIVITEGLKEGEKVVTNGQLGVTPGGKVKEGSAPSTPNQGESS